MVDVVYAGDIPLDVRASVEVRAKNKIEIKKEKAATGGKSMGPPLKGSSPITY